jgi:hypothetical protein
MVTTREIDKLIKADKSVQVYFPEYRETAILHIIRRDRWNVYTDNGGKFDRSDMELIIEENTF